jgi:hypothetical protein
MGGTSGWSYINQLSVDIVPFNGMTLRGAISQKSGPSAQLDEELLPILNYSAMELELIENLEIDIEWGRLAPALVVVLDRYLVSFPSLKS